MRKLVVVVLIGIFASCNNETIENIEQKQDLTELQLKIIQQIGIENIVSFETNKNYQLRGDTGYPSEPLCQSLEYANSEDGGWVVYEWNGKYYYGFRDVIGYTEVVVTETFAKSFCKGRRL